MGQKYIACCQTCFVIFISIIMLGFAVADLVLGIQGSECDTTDAINLNVSDYLIGLGIYQLVNWLIFVIIYCNVIFAEKDVSERDMISSVVLQCMTSIFGFVWFILGAIILFRSNLDCIHQGTTMVIYALVLWCINAFSVIQSCFKTSSININNN